MKTQLTLPKLTIQVSNEVDGLEMGVLSNGTAYLSGRSLSKLCGVKNSSISEATTDWANGASVTKLAKWLATEGFSRASLYTETTIPGVAGNVKYAYEDDICNLILDYYALEVGNETAKANYRRLARAGLRMFVYHSLGYDPKNVVPPSWKQFHDRMLLASAPAGFFSVFKESAPMLVSAIKAGLPVDETSVPDISIGSTWSAHWKAQGLSDAFGEPGQHDHNYPEYFPQAKSNPQKIRVYPLKALGEFRTWMEEVYIPEKFPVYVKAKIAKGLLPPSAAELLLGEAPEPKKLPEPA